MFFDMKRPSPVPVLYLVVVVANFVNSLGNTSESMPEPVSFTLTIISLLFGTTAVVIVPSFVNLMALLRRFEITWLILLLSASMKISSLGPVNSNFRLIVPWCSLMTRL